MNKKWKKVCDLIRKIFKKQTGVDIMSNEEKIIDALYRSYQLTDKYDNTLFIELSRDGSYWNVNSGGIFKTSYGKNRKEVYNRHTTDKQSTEIVEESQNDGQSGTQSNSSMNSPTLLEDKATNNIPNTQEGATRFRVANENQAISALGKGLKGNRVLM